MKPLSKAKQATIAKNRGVPVREGVAAMNARGKLLPAKASELAMAIAASIGKRHA